MPTAHVSFALNNSSHTNYFKKKGGRGAKGVWGPSFATVKNVKYWIEKSAFPSLFCSLEFFSFLLLCNIFAFMFLVVCMYCVCVCDVYFFRTPYFLARGANKTCIRLVYVVGTRMFGI